MKRLTIAIVGILVLFTSCSTQPVNRDKSNPESSLLWEISGNGLEKPSYLFGTMHIISKDDFFMPKHAMESLEKTDALVLEMDIDIPVKEQVAMAQHIILPDGKTLADYMSVEDYELFKSICIDSLGIGEGKFKRYSHMKPIFLSGILMAEYVGKVESYEKYFMSKSKKLDKEFIPLETLEFQLSMFDKIPIEEQVKDMKATELIPELNKLIDSYLSQDLTRIQTVIEETEMDDKTEWDLLINRNLNWKVQLIELMPKKSLFIAVGAAHLPGEQGVINLLKDSGYTVKPL